jgi:hypothetical protein
MSPSPFLPLEFPADHCNVQLLLSTFEQEQCPLVARSIKSSRVGRKTMVLAWMMG